ncbi:MAG: GtrA family protein [Clostridia bacterium]|nr:GtrA family protein [Clostridia bacterium]
MKKFLQKFTTNHPRLAEIMRFLIVGGLATIIDFLAMGITLYAFNPKLYPHFYNVWIGGGAPTTLATIMGTAIGFIAGLIFNYIFSIIFVFQEKGNSRSAKGFILFTLLSLGGLLIHITGMYIGYNLLGINEWVLKIIFTLIVLAYNYITRKLIIFTTTKQGKQL